MAGSLAHITGDHGEFTLDLIENLGDAAEALEECFYIIQHLGTREQISAACKALRYPDPYEPDPYADEDEDEEGRTP